MKSGDIRQTFLDYFVRRGHTLVPSSSLVPTNDPTLLFSNAGMVQFKDVFLGREQRPYARACSSQKCLRVSGKHNDIESVGASPRHHTFFEMLGNFSFADYFKRDAMRYAWELLTQEFKLPSERLWITIHHDDDEAARLWEEVGVERQRILRFGDKENFWSMGETGPCGPSSEIHYYQGAEMASQRHEGVNSDDDDYWEVWNLVFVQYNRDEQGVLTPLSRPSIDTGMGLERLTAILQGVKSDYETDLFVPLLHKLMELTGQTSEYYQQHLATYNAIVDHSRAVAFLIADGVQPGNGGRNYVLRRLIRRASYFGRTIGLEQPFLSQLAQVVIEQMADCYPELQREKQRIIDLITSEEIRFQRTLAKGLRFLEMALEDPSCQHDKLLSGREAFKLYDTYGFPLDLTQKILSERGLRVDLQQYEEERVRQQQRSRNASN
ncbi:MAG TPA: alanine--tRNA ligase [Ktedonobacteraceae bacterium]|nr:alanine--tRNA ligase [Ktedonobacteraceae bacterium]